jgi:hypothetical protein
MIVASLWLTFAENIPLGFTNKRGTGNGFRDSIAQMVTEARRD